MKYAEEPIPLIWVTALYAGKIISGQIKLIHCSPIGKEAGTFLWNDSSYQAYGKWHVCNDNK
ncbi:MAG: hypothetical protein ACLVAW_16555 [Eisenbergiella massiliensis]